MDLVEEFQKQALGVGARCEILDGALLPVAIEERLRAISAAKVAISDSPLVSSLVPQLATSTRVVQPDGSRGDLFDADAGVTAVQWGIAETGTLVLVSATERHRLASLVPPIHIALLPASCIVGTMCEVLEGIAHAPHNQAVTFITGPSRTADIELTLVVGVHGPRQLDICVIRDR
jgi:L-lactate dehydrogenase complex protein LldG